MNAFEMRKEDFEKIEYRKWSDEITCSSLVVIPTDSLHDSGWMTMDIVALDEKMNPICRCGGCSDVVNMDGIGGYGLDWERNLTMKKINIHGWSFDCLPCGYIRLWCNTKILIRAGLSNLEIYALGDEEKKNDIYVDKNYRWSKLGE